MSRIRFVPHAVFVVAATCMPASCATMTVAAPRPDSISASTAAEYPQQLRGNWMPTDMACTTPINHDSDVLVVITKNHLEHYEEANKPLEVRRISSDPHAWSVKSMLNFGGDGYNTPLSEVFVLGGLQLAIVGKNGAKTYQKCN